MNNGKLDEPSLIKLYMDLTGAAESSARSVVMHVCSKDKENSEIADGAEMETWRRDERARR